MKLIKMLNIPNPYIIFMFLGRKSNDKTHPDYIPSIQKQPENVNKPSCSSSSATLKRALRHENLITKRMKQKDTEITSKDDDSSDVEDITENSVLNSKEDSKRIQDLERIISEQKEEIATQKKCY